MIEECDHNCQCCDIDENAAKEYMEALERLEIKCKRLKLKGTIKLGIKEGFIDPNFAEILLEKHKKDKSTKLETQLSYLREELRNQHNICKCQNLDDEMTGQFVVPPFVK